ncbi:hypothetical protein [Microlunatus sp. Y2014]|uniref:hypothetical protein n=1 Tax=Microlunatus sp. Y2014 TaxID=3418488 RepID=UPI003DA760FE
MTWTSPSPTTTSPDTTAPDTTAPDTTAPDTTAPGTVATFRAAELAVTTAPATGSDRDVAWLSPRQAPFEVAGFGWFAEEGVYRRLPQRSPWPLRPEVDRKADATPAGSSGSPPTPP